ncbi:MAG TPA: DUF3313 family protein [Rhizomicrobium sp.]|nr:DUF3313 family protein [Rhizomicrobium sp.]
MKTVSIFAFVLLASAQTALADPPARDSAEGKLCLAGMRTGTDLTQYRTVLFAPLAVPPDVQRAVPPNGFPPVAAPHQTTDRDVRRLQDAFSRSMQSVLWRNGYRVVTVPDDHTLIVFPRAVKIVLNPQVQRGNYGIDYILSSTVGSLEISAVLVDGATRKPIGEIGGREYSANLWGIDPAFIPWSGAGDAFDEWATDLSDMLRAR